MSGLRRLMGLGIIVLIWLIGLFVFADRVVESTPALEPDTPSDAIVVLTGASDKRLREGMRLLERRQGERLLISGVDSKATRSEILQVIDGSKRLFDCCVDLGFEAMNTVGNAKEIGAWARARGYKSLIVVTSDYHMPRSLLKIKGELPHVRLTPVAVATPELDARTWWKSPKATRLLVLEYSKYLVMMVKDGLTDLGRSLGIVKDPK